jgi:Na+-transporting methylmalonyl-CoA/oxaloacetate decarboxylase gamma subunit
VFAYATVVLSAMQVGLATQDLGRDRTFQWLSYGFAVFSIGLALVGIVSILLVLLYLICSTLVRTNISFKEKEGERTKEAQGLPGTPEVV